MLNEVLNYTNNKNEDIKIIYDEKTDRTIIWNLDTKKIFEVEENYMEDIKTTILDFVCNDIMELDFISDFFIVESEDLESFEAENKEIFIEELKNFNIEIE